MVAAYSWDAPAPPCLRASAQAVPATEKALPLPFSLLAPSDRSGLSSDVSSGKAFLTNQILLFSLEYCLIPSLIRAHPSFHLYTHLFVEFSLPPP